MNKIARKTRNRIILHCGLGCFLGIFAFTLVSILEHKRSVTLVIIVDIIIVVFFVLLMVIMLKKYPPKSEE